MMNLSKQIRVKKYLGPFDFVREMGYFDLQNRLNNCSGHEHPLSAFGKPSELSGVYAFFDGLGIEGKCLYVGKTVNLSTRMTQHMNGQTDWYKKYVVDAEGDECMYENPYIITVGIKFAPKEKLIAFEHKFIYDFKPKYNAA